MRNRSYIHVFLDEAAERKHDTIQIKQSNVPNLQIVTSLHLKLLR